MVLGLIVSSRTARAHWAPFRRAQHAAGHRKFHLPDNLVVNGQAVVRIDLEEHGRTRVYYRTSTVSIFGVIVKHDEFAASL